MAGPEQELGHLCKTRVYGKDQVMPKISRGRFLLLLPVVLALLFFVSPVGAKMSTDFDPNLDFSKFKTFAFIGGVEELVRMQLNPEQLNNQIHRAVTRELSSQGTSRGEAGRESGLSGSILG